MMTSLKKTSNRRLMMNNEVFMDMDSMNGNDVYSFIDNMSSHHAEEDTFADMDFSSLDSDMMDEEF
jgi:hypothetical protein